VPDASTHAALAHAAERLAEVTGENRTWLVVALHYLALHRIEGELLEPRGLHSSNHHRRESSLLALAAESGFGWLARVAEALADMRSKSTLARYVTPPENWTDAHIEQQRALLPQISALVDTNQQPPGEPEAQ